MGQCPFETQFGQPLGSILFANRIEGQRTGFNSKYRSFSARIKKGDCRAAPEIPPPAGNGAGNRSTADDNSGLVQFHDAGLRIDRIIGIWDSGGVRYSAH
jgi:hypothetical protein